VLFNPPVFMRNRHIQSILASGKIRKPFIRRSAKSMLGATQEQLLPGGENVRLHCLVSRHSQSNGARQGSLVILIHGWEGSADSNYLLSAASALFNAGHNIVRLHLRDHGPSHHLNSDLFHAARIDEVAAAIKSITELFPEEKTNLVGFSLGGNFALRIAAQASIKSIPLEKVIAICPVISPPKTMAALETGSPIYRGYFMAKWRKSLLMKHGVFPEIVKLADIKKAKNLMDLTEYLVDQHTDFRSVEEYFDDYTLTGSALAQISVPTEIITSKDDPVIPADDFRAINGSPLLNINLQPYGGHCGFIKDYHFNSWINDVLIDRFKSL
jgi:predicted alpha/beta-fold hydrolase